MSSSGIVQIEAQIGTLDPKVRIANVRREAGDAVRCEAIGYCAQRLCMHTIRQPKT